ncbi:MAG: hypothetical protein JWR16_586 [Nevskia sp.]|nr:hypothetical protein [Nevskia sp.]
MKLQSPFYRLPLSVDHARLQQEIAQFEETEWQHHPTGFAGNSAIRLISVGGGPSDDFAGPMSPTQELQRCPYIRQILAAFGVVWSRSRLMRLDLGARVPEHCDVNYHWFNRVRVHIPVQTDPNVLFTCGDQTVHMAVGEVWLFDNWRQHSVHNGSARKRIHLVADTTGNAGFWNMLAASRTENFAQPHSAAKLIPYTHGVEASPLCERHNVGVIMHPAEVDLLTGDLINDLRDLPGADGRVALTSFVGLTLTFVREWRMLWSMFGEAPDGWPHFQKLRDWAIEQNGRQSRAVVCDSNGMAAIEVFYPRVLVYACQVPDQLAELADVDRTISAASTSISMPTIRGSRDRPIAFRKPVFIVAAPRSGSTLLFETLAQARDLWTVGGESHWLVENLPQLLPWAPGVGSNRLTAAHVDQAVREHVIESLAAQLRDRQQRAYAGGAVRVLEKTPKHALRIPFFENIFPDALFIYLWREPQGSLASMMEAWRSGGWITYQELPGWDGPWSLLLPPGWQDLRGRPLEEVAAFQWQQTNEIILDDLAKLPERRWTTLSYAEFVADPAACVRRVCEFAEIGFDDGLAEHVSRPLPLSAHTLSQPAPNKWRSNEAEIMRVLPGLQTLHERLLQLTARNAR